MVSRLTALLLLSASVASAQEVMAPRVFARRDVTPHVAATGPTTQGSMWIDSGGSSPLEKDFAIRVFAEEGAGRDHGWLFRCRRLCEYNHQRGPAQFGLEPFRAW